MHIIRILHAEIYHYYTKGQILQVYNLFKVVEVYILEAFFNLDNPVKLVNLLE